MPTTLKNILPIIKAIGNKNGGSPSGPKDNDIGYVVKTFDPYKSKNGGSGKNLNDRTTIIKTYRIFACMQPSSKPDPMINNRHGINVITTGMIKSPKLVKRNSTT